KAIDRQRLPARIFEQSVECSGHQIIRGDKPAGLGVSATGELPDEEVMAEASEIEWRQRHAPRSIQPLAVLQTPQETAGGAVDIHEAQPWTVCFKRRPSLVQRIGDDN